VKKKVKKQLSKKQLANLAIGRAKRAENLNKKVKDEAITPTIAEEKTIAVPPPKESNKKKNKASFSIKKAGFFILALVLIGVSIYCGKIWMDDTEKMLFGIATVVFFAGGALSLILALKKIEVTSSRPSLRHGEQRNIGLANSITIYAKQDAGNPQHLLPDRIAFEQLENPPGLKRKLRNNGKYYYLNLHDTTGLKDCVLPDNQYCDPHRFLIPVLMKHSQEYYTPVPSLLQRIKPILFIAVVVIGGVILAMVNTPATPGG
jgi:hypothetical protein